MIAIRGLLSFFYRHYPQELLVRRFCERRLRLPAMAKALRLDIRGTSYTASVFRVASFSLGTPVL